MARRRNQNRPITNEPGFSIEAVRDYEEEGVHVSIYTLKEKQLKAVRDAYMRILTGESEEIATERKKLAVLISTLQSVYGNIPESENVIGEDGALRAEHTAKVWTLTNKAIWFLSMGSGLRKALHEYLTEETGELTPEERRHIAVYLVQEITFTTQAYDSIYGQLDDELGEAILDLDLYNLSYNWTSPVDSVTNQQSIYTINAQERYSLNPIMVDWSSRVNSVLNEVFQSASSNGPNHWQLITGSNGIEGVLLNGRRINATSMQVRAEPGSVTRLNLEVLIVPTSDILTFTSTSAPGNSDGGLRNRRTDTTTPVPPAPTPPSRPNHVRRLDI